MCSGAGVGFGVQPESSQTLFAPTVSDGPSQGRASTEPKGAIIGRKMFTVCRILTSDVGANDYLYKKSRYLFHRQGILPL